MHTRKENIAANELSVLTNTGNHKYTHDSNYKTETIPKKYETDEITEGIFPIQFKLYIATNVKILNL